MSLINDNLGWWIAGAIVVIGLVGFGLRDLLRFSPRRIWAISSVCFAESIRRRVLWITPLAILGVIIVAQLQHPIDEQDAIRQTIKFCLFATGLLVTIVVIILACTNLPKEIDTRVIYTIVTKPTTRLEIILGKVIGFARVSAAILIIMGLFTWGYLHLRAWNMQRYIARQLASGDVGPARKPSLEHYQQSGLLQARQLQDADSYEIFAKLPQPSDPVRWMFSEQNFIVPFKLGLGDIAPPNWQSGQPLPPLMILAHVYTQEAPLTDEQQEQLGGDLLRGLGTDTGGPRLSTTQSTMTAKRPAPKVAVQILDRNGYTLLTPNILDATSLTLHEGQPLQIQIPAEQVMTLINHGRFFVSIAGGAPGWLYGADSNPVILLAPTAQAGQFNQIPPAPDPRNPNRPTPPIFEGRGGTHGQQLRGGPAEHNPVGVYRFHNVPVPASGQVPFEMRVGIERTGNELSTSTDDLTRLSISVRNLKTGVIGQPIAVTPESLRPTYFSLPAGDLGDGNFELILRNHTNGHWVGLQANSVFVVTSHQPFIANLSKSLLILWLMTLLVIIIAILCSTFLSWPIAVVLTIVLLLGRWGVMQLGDSLGSGIGNQIATDFGFSDPSQAKVVSSSVEALTKALTAISHVLPDISRFSATEDVERGVMVPTARLYESGAVAFGFGLPMIVLAYIFLKNKEVAP
ncbi:MAG: hypothetical protein IT446_05200 [Phycisphaerales bacterium]|nr:hypothetical protein [Phycisphaerales bacterium]